MAGSTNVSPPPISGFRLKKKHFAPAQRTSRGEYSGEIGQKNMQVAKKVASMVCTTWKQQPFVNNNTLCHRYQVASQHYLLKEPAPIESWQTSDRTDGHMGEVSSCVVPS
jgi:hypothetical protein